MPRITREPGHYGNSLAIWCGGTDVDVAFAPHSLSGGLCAGVPRRLPNQFYLFPHLAINLNDTIRGETAAFRSFRIQVEQAFLDYREPSDFHSNYFTGLFSYLRDAVGEVSDQQIIEALIANALESALLFNGGAGRRGINLRSELAEIGREVFSTLSPFERRQRPSFATFQDIAFLFFQRYWLDYSLDEPFSVGEWDWFASYLANDAPMWSAFCAGANLGRQRGRRLPAWYSVGEPLPTVPARTWSLEPGALTMGFEIEVDFFDSTSQHPRRDVANALERLGWSSYSGEYSDRTNGLLFGVRPDGSTHSEVCSPIFSISTFEGFALASDAIRDVCKALVECGGGVRSNGSRSGFHLHFGRGTFSSRTRHSSRSLVVDDKAMARFLSSTVGQGWPKWSALQPPSRRSNHYAQRSQCFYGSGQADYDLARWFDFMIDDGDCLINSGGHTSAVDSLTNAWGTCEIRLGASAVLQPDKLIGWLGVNRSLYLRSVNDNVLEHRADERLSDWVKRLMAGEPGRSEAVALAVLREGVI